jgi:hypothetical protein
MDTDQDRQTADAQRAKIMREVDTLSRPQLIIIAAAAAAINDAGDGTISDTLAAEWNAITSCRPIILEDVEMWLRVHHYIRPAPRDAFKANYLGLVMGDTRN